MSGLWQRVLDVVETRGAAATVRVTMVRGSAPREAGATMVLQPDGGFWGTIGGGALEWEAIAAARRLLEGGRGPAVERAWPLGPDLGQCCGGSVVTVTETFDRSDCNMLLDLCAAEDRCTPMVGRIEPDGRVLRRASPAAGTVGQGEWLEAPAARPFPLLLLGAGHVGRALALALAPLPVTVTWLDARADAFPALVPANAQARVLGDPVSAVAAAPSGAALAVMTHSHALDLSLVAAALGRRDLGPVGLIGSATKRARFLARLRAIDLGGEASARLVCPIGIAGIAGKEPAVIAASIAAQVLLWRERALAGAGAPWPDMTGNTDETGRGSQIRAERRANPAAEVRIGRGRRAGGQQQ